MIKSELIKRISSQNPHLYERDIDKIVSVILDEMVEALRRGDRVELRGFGAFSAKVREHVKGATPVLVLPSRSETKLFPPSRRERACASGLIGKLCRQTDSRRWRFLPATIQKERDRHNGGSPVCSPSLW